MKIVKNQMFFEQSLLLAASLLLVTGVLMVMSYHDFIKLLNKNLGQTSQSSSALIEIRIGTSTTITTEVVMVVGIPCVDILMEGKAAIWKEKKDSAPIIEVCSKAKNLDGNDIRSVNIFYSYHGWKTFYYLPDYKPKSVITNRGNYHLHSERD